MLTKNIQLMTAEIDAHRAADLLVQGNYFDAGTGRGCFIGCLAHGNNPAVIADSFGLPQPLTRLLEFIFERLPFGEAADFFSAIPRAIGRDGRDLTRVQWAFLADLLRHLPDTGDGGIVADVIVGMDLLASGQEWSEEAMAMAWSAVEARAEYWAAEEARAEYWAAEAAYWAAEAGAKSARATAVAEEATYWVARAAEAAAEGAEETRRQRDAILRLIREVPAPAPDDRR